MATQIYKSESLCINYEMEYSLMTIIMLPGSISLTEEDMKAGTLTIVELLKAYQPKYYISDQYEMACPFFVEIQEWVAITLTEVFIEIGLQKFAYIKPLDVINSLSTEQTIEEARALPIPFEVKACRDMEDARAWVMEA